MVSNDRKRGLLPSFCWKSAFVLGILCFAVGLVRLSHVAQSQLAKSLAFADHEMFYLPRTDNKTETVDSRRTAGEVSSHRLPKLPVVPKPDPFPAIHEIVQILKDGTNATAAQFILDIAIVGFAKCGTSTMMYWLGQHPEISIPPMEITALKTREPWEFVRGMHQRTGTDPKVMRGYKSPNDITDPRAIRLLRQHWPKTKIIVGIRHPVRMMESFYNHRVQNGFDIRPFDRLKYVNLPNSFGVHFSRAEYQVHLANLGKTDVAHNHTEQGLFPETTLQAWNASSFPQSSPNPIFIYDTAQLNDSNEARLQGFLQDLQNFLGLSQPLPPPLHERPGKEQVTERQREIDLKKINVCDDRYEKQRNLLTRKGAKVQEWILDHFLTSPSVYVANRRHFRELVRMYGDDPCKKPSQAAGTNISTSS